MPFRAWLFIAALGIISSTSLQAQEPSGTPLEGQPVTSIRQDQGGAESNQTPADQQGPSDVLAPILQGIEAAIRDLVPIEDSAERQRQQQNEERDLEAQEEMALWAKGMFWATFAAVVLTLAALIAIVRTLHHTKIAAQQSVIMAEQAKLSTKAAQAAVKITERMGEAQVRAYLNVTQASLTSDMVRPDTVMLVVRNSGQSPAYDVRLFFRAKNPGGILHGLGVFGDDTITEAPAFGVVAAGSEDKFYFCLYPAEDDDAASQRQKPDQDFLIIEAILQYKTVFDRGTKRVDNDTSFTLICSQPAGSRSEDIKMDIATNLRCDWIDKYRMIMKAKGENDRA